MSFSKSYIPYGAYWTTPFCRWQGSFSSINSIKLAGQVAASVLAAKKIDPKIFDGLHLGITVPQQHGFYGAPWLAGMIGAPDITGPTIGQACATSGRLVANACLEIEAGTKSCILSVACDRTSNGPHIYYPNPAGPGGKGDSEDWVWDNFGYDPYGKQAMLQTAENVAKEQKITKQQQDEITLLRNKQYQDALKDDRAFQKRYMFPVTIKKGKKEQIVDADEGVFSTTKEGLEKLRPVQEEGTVTYGTQTFPADANAGIIICTKDQAQKLSADSRVTIQVISYGEARTDKTFMPKAVVPAAMQAAQRAGIKIKDCKAIKTHNPFAVNDVYFCKETGLSPDSYNNFGSPLVWGHPQAPMGFRAIIELIEEIVAKGGGYGLFSGCAAGDTAMAIVVKVS